MDPPKSRPRKPAKDLFARKPPDVWLAASGRCRSIVPAVLEGNCGNVTLARGRSGNTVSASQTLCAKIANDAKPAQITDRGGAVTQFPIVGTILDTDDAVARLVGRRLPLPMPSDFTLVAAPSGQ